MSGLSFYGPLADEGEALFGEYLAYLRARNGDFVTFGAREARMVRYDHVTVHAGVAIDAARFNRNYARLTETDVSREELALLAFVKINAGEAYGVRVVGEARRGRADEGLASRVEAVVQREEEYHTRLLVGATGHFEGLSVHGAWTPTWPLRLLIEGLARTPSVAFHPVLLGAEISGVYTFNWLLSRLKGLFPNDQAVRASMEERLIEILVDEIGHVAYNRARVGAAGTKVAGRVARMVTEGHRVMSPELRLLGFDDDAIRGVEGFDYGQLPEEVRGRGFFA